MKEIDDMKKGLKKFAFTIGAIGLIMNACANGNEEAATPNNTEKAAAETQAEKPKKPATPWAFERLGVENKGVPSYKLADEPWERPSMTYVQLVTNANVTDEEAKKIAADYITKHRGDGETLDIWIKDGKAENFRHHAVYVVSPDGWLLIDWSDRKDAEDITAWDKKQKYPYVGYEPVNRFGE
jgi:hypothetical protein